MSFKIKKGFFWIFVVSVLSSEIAGAESDKPLDIKGFATITGGQTDRDDIVTYDGLGKRYNANALSSYGLIFNKQLNEKWDGALMLLARGISDTNFATEVEWGQMSFHASSNLTMRFGKQKFPLYLISDLEPTSVLYPWIRPPAEVYSFVPIFSYNGVSAEYVFTDVGGGDLSVSAYQAQLDGTVRGTTPYVIKGLGFGAAAKYHCGKLTLNGSYFGAKIDTFTFVSPLGQLSADMSMLYDWSLGGNYESDNFIAWYERASLNSDAQFFTHKTGDYLTLGYYLHQKAFLPYLSYARTLVHVAGGYIGNILIDDAKQKSLKAGFNYYYNTDLVVKLEYERTWIREGTDVLTTTNDSIHDVPSGFVDTKAISITAIF